MNTLDTTQLCLTDRQTSIINIALTNLYDVIPMGHGTKMRDDIFTHVQIWEKAYKDELVESEIEKLLGLLKSYNENELKYLKLDKNIYITAVKQESDSTFKFELMDETDEVKFDAKGNIRNSGYSVDAGVQIDDIFELFVYSPNRYEPRSPSPTSYGFNFEDGYEDRVGRDYRFEPKSPEAEDSSIEKYLPPKPGEEDKEQKYVMGSDGELSPDYLPPK